MIDVLVLSPVPTCPVDFGHRKRVRRICAALQDRGAHIHFLHYAMDWEWRGTFARDSYLEMQRQWDVVEQIAPTIAPHRRPAGLDHDIDDWWDPAIGNHLKWLFKRRSFDAFIVNYAYHSKALDFAPPGVVRILDTHDKFSGRRELLGSFGIPPEFFYTTPDQEAIGLRRADVVLAIKEHEKLFFEDLCEAAVITTPHVDPSADVWRSRPERTALVVGFIGARNNVNLVNFKRFFEALDEKRRVTRANISLVVAGSLCDDIYALVDGAPWVDVRGRVDDVTAFYAELDLAVVPMTFSTGLKIKVAEALGLGLPIVSTAHAFEGFEARHDHHRLNDMDDLADALIDIAFDREPALRALKAATTSAQADAMSAFDGALDEIVDFICSNRRNKLIVSVPRSYFLKRSAYRYAFLNLLAELRGDFSVIAHCDAADLAPNDAAELEPLARLCEVYVDGGGEPSRFRRASLADLARRWLAATLLLTDRASASPETSADGPIAAQAAIDPFFGATEADFPNVVAAGLGAPTPDMLGEEIALGRIRRLAPFLSDAAGSAGWPKELPRWRAPARRNAPLLTILCDRYVGEAGEALVDALRRAFTHLRFQIIVGAEAERVRAASAAPPRVAVCAVEEVLRDLHAIADRPTIVIDLSEEQTAFDFIRELSAQARIDRITYAQGEERVGALAQARVDRPPSFAGLLSATVARLMDRASHGFSPTQGVVSPKGRWRILRARLGA